MAFLIDGLLTIIIGIIVYGGAWLLMRKAIRVLVKFFKRGD